MQIVEKGKEDKSVDDDRSEVDGGSAAAGVEKRSGGEEQGRQTEDKLGGRGCGVGRELSQLVDGRQLLSQHSALVGVGYTRGYLGILLILGSHSQLQTTHHYSVRTHS